MTVDQEQIPKKKRYSLGEAEELVTRASDKNHQASAGDIAKETGLSKGTIAKTTAWAKHHARKSAKKAPSTSGIRDMQQKRSFSNLEANTPDPADEVGYWIDLEWRYKNRASDKQNKKYNEASVDERRDILTSFYIETSDPEAKH